MLIFLTLALTGCSEDDEGNILLESWGGAVTKTTSNVNGTFTRTQYCRVYANDDDKCVANDFDSHLLTEMKINKASFYSYEHGSQIDGNDTYSYTAGDMSLGNRDEVISLVYRTDPVIVGKDRLKGSFVEFKSLGNHQTHFLNAGNILKDANTSALKERHGIVITYKPTGKTTVDDIEKIELLNNLVVERICKLKLDDFVCTDKHGLGLYNKATKKEIDNIVPVFPSDENDAIYKKDITYLILEAFKFQNFT